MQIPNVYSNLPSDKNRDDNRFFEAPAPCFQFPTQTK